MTKEKIESLCWGFGFVLFWVVASLLASSKEPVQTNSMTYEQYAQAEAALRFASH